MKGFGFLLQLCLLTFGLTAHALTLEPSAVSPDALYERLISDNTPHEDPYANRPETLKRAHFPLAKARISETGPYEKEEEEEIRTTGTSFKIITTSGSGTSAFFCAPDRLKPVLDPSLATGPFRLADLGATTPRRILFQVFRL